MSDSFLRLTDVQLRVPFSRSNQFPKLLLDLTVGRSFCTPVTVLYKIIPDFRLFSDERAMESSSGDVTELLQQLRAGNRGAEEFLIPLVYSELRRIAAIRLRGERHDHSLEPTALVHEAYLRLTRMTEMDWQCRSHFFAVSATLMRRILVDHARGKLAEKRGERPVVITISGADLVAPERPPEILALDEALHRLAQLDERQSKVVDLRFFGGLSEAEIAEVLRVSVRTVKRDWRAARAWLFAELHC